MVTKPGGRPGRWASRGQEPGKTNVAGDVTNGGWVCQAEFKRDLVKPGGRGPRPGQTKSSALRLRGRRIVDREVVQERFVGPLTGVVTRPRLLVWSGGARRLGDREEEGTSLSPDQK